MIVDISKMTLNNIHFFNLVGNVRKGQHLTDEEKNFLKSLERLKEEKVPYKPWIREAKKKAEKMSAKDYQHWYYLNVTKIKRKQKNF